MVVESSKLTWILPDTIDATKQTMVASSKKHIPPGKLT